jgi:hypothetical protein
MGYSLRLHELLQHHSKTGNQEGYVLIVFEMRELLDKYLSWLRDKTAIREVGDFIEITTPYLDRHNDYLQIYAKKENGSFLLTDDGYILDDLEQSGCKIISPKRQQLLNITLNGFGIQLKGKALQVSTTADTFAIKKHNLVQAMLAINDMFYLAEPMVASIFYEDVVSWLDLHEIRYTPRIKFTGRSGFDHSFDFVIPKSRSSPERILQTLNRPNKDSTTLLAFAWVDTKEVRPPDSKAFAFLNDQEQTVPVDVIEALRSYEVTPIAWSQRENLLTEFAS